MTSATPPPVHAPKSVPHRSPVLLKLAVLAVILLALQVPLLLVRNTLHERRAFRDQAVASIGEAWGAAQEVAGPFLAVPYVVATRMQRDMMVGDRLVRSEEVREVEGTAWFLPSRLEAEGEVETEWRARGIFRVPVFTARMRLAGVFAPVAAGAAPEGARLQWSAARVVLFVADPRGLRSAPVWSAGEVVRSFAPGAPRAGWPTPIEAPVALAEGGAGIGEFEVELVLRGTRRLAIAPIGESTGVALSGAWVDPGFDGPALPGVRETGADGFCARWEVAQFGREFPRQWAEHPGRDGAGWRVFQSSAVGVSLLEPVDAYRLVERSLKYALLFLVLVAGVFFLLEITAGDRVHPLQYLVVGAALALFYLGFLALAEFFPVGRAYTAAAAASTLSIALYARGIFGRPGRAVALGSGLAATYGYLFFILRLQDFALIAGTGALFVLLAVTMWVTRRLGGGAAGETR